MANDSLPRSSFTGKPLTWERLRAAVHYDPVTGIFTRLSSYNNTGVGRPVGCFNGAGYLVTSINGCADYGHRFAWFYMTGEWPPKGAEIDHIDGDPSNNVFANLRLTNHAGNMQNGRFRKNNTSGIKGVFKVPSGWAAAITAGGAAKHLGIFRSKDEAACAYKAAAEVMHGEFVRDLVRPDTGG